jgi:nucleotidyltransferase substrate binding protein (TIGR01987 family)
MKLSFDHLQRCSLTLERSLQSLGSATPGSLDAEVARNAVIKSFELTLETAGKMLSKTLKLYAGSPRSVDSLTFKDLFREGARHGLLSQDELERWLIYRDSRNETAHQYGEALAENTLRLIGDFQRDAITLYETLRSKHG